MESQSTEKQERIPVDPKQELVKHIDENNNELGGVTRAQMRKEKLWHRASYIFITDSAGKFCIQKRTDLKDYCPGFYDLVTGGVVDFGEDDDTSASRELAEELGIEGVKLDLICAMPFGTAWMNCYHWKYSGEEMKLQASEVQWVEWWTREELEQKIEEGSGVEITPCSIYCYRTLKEQGKI